MSVPYRRASQHGLLWVGIVFTGIGCSIVLGLMLSKQLPWGWMMAIFMAPILGAIALCVAITSRIKRERIRGIQAALEREPFVVDIEAGAERKAAVFAPVADLQRRVSLRNGAGGITWLALDTAQPGSICIFEHIHVTGSGKTTQEHRNTIVAFAARRPTGIAHVSAYRPRWLTRRAFTRGGAVVAIGDPGFERQWVILGEADGARAFFTESMRTLLADSPRGESWHVGPAWIACVYDGAFDAHNLALFRRRCTVAVGHSGLAANLRSR